MCEFYIIGQKRPMQIKVRNKITGRIKEYKANYVVTGTFFFRFDNIFLPRLIYEKIEMCKFCEEKFPIITHYGKFKIDKFSNNPVITCDLNKCPSFAVCSSKDMNVEMVMGIVYCPICGRKLVEE